MGRVQCIVNGSDNLVSIVLYSDGVPLDMPTAGVTRVQVEVDDGLGTVVDSNVVTMDWSTLVSIDGVDSYPITFIGADAALAVGTYRDCRVRVFDSQNPNGLIWPDVLTLVVT